MSTSDFPTISWDTYARYYDSLNSLRPYKELLEVVAREIVSHPGSNILDAACGTGNLIVEISRHPSQKAVAVHGIDSSSAMLTRARQKNFGKLKVNFLHQNLEGRLPFASNTFEHLASINTLYAMSNPENVLREFYRILSVNGYLFLVTPKEGYQNGLILKEHCGSIKPDDYWLDKEYSKEREELLVGEAITDNEVRLQILAVSQQNRIICKHTHFHFYSEVALISLLEQIGFCVTSSSLVYARQNLFIIAQKRS